MGQLRERFPTREEEALKAYVSNDTESRYICSRLREDEATVLLSVIQPRETQVFGCRIDCMQYLIGL